MKVKGLHSYFFMGVQAFPAQKSPDVRLGFDYNGEKSKLKVTHDLLKQFNTEATFSSLTPCKKFLVGGNVVVSPLDMKFSKVDLGLVW